MYEYSEKIVRKLVEHYKDEEAIVAWQIDNEIGHEGSDMCHCPKCHKAFQEYLRAKFKGDIHTLNDTYGTTFWSQEYNDFDEIPVPTQTITTHNPALRLDWERFRSKSIVDFITFQFNLIKEIAPNANVMHDFPGGGLGKHVDYSKVAHPLDFVAYNNYPVWGGQKEPIAPHEIAFGLDYIRGLKQQNFWITEAIMGAQGHDITGFLPRPNQAKMWSYQGLARGCTSMMYFRYRGATKGAEQFCYGILDADNVKRRKFYEVKSLFEDVIQYKDSLETPIHSDVAIVYDYDSLAAFRIQRQSILLDCENEMKKFYKTFYDVNVMVDIIPADADFSNYKVVILPQMIITRPEFRKRVEAFANNGGTVVLTYRNAVKDENNNLTLGECIPVGYSELAGIYVEETESLQELDAFPIIGHGACEGSQGSGGIFRDMLVVKDAEVLYSYGDKFYTDYAAITRKACGQGMLYYIGCSPDSVTLKQLMENIMKDMQIKTKPSKAGVEIVERGEGREKIQLFINHNDYAVKEQDVELEAFECKIVHV
jgi:beta-galactosidase